MAEIDKIEELCKEDGDGNTELGGDACGQYDLGDEIDDKDKLLDKLDPHRHD